MTKTKQGLLRALRQPSKGLLLAATALALAGCGEKKDAEAAQAAVKVNKEEITVGQVNHVLQQQRGLRPEQAEAAGRQVLERLIDQELAVQKADDLKLERDPKVAQQLEAARREIIARAYFERIGEAAPKPGADEIAKVYNDKPALFKERRIYNLQEILVEARPEQLAGLREQLAASKNINEFVERLKAEGIRFAANQVVRGAEQLPLANLEAFARMKDGQATISQTASGMAIVVLAGSREQPLSEQQARPLIEQFLLAERRRKLIEDDLKAMRAAARITYVGRFAEPAASAPAAAASAASAAWPAADPAKDPGPK